jgi:hypothetical protein
VIRMKQSWRTIELAKNESEALDVVYVSCVVCRAIPNVHDPITDLLPKYIGSSTYSTFTKPGQAESTYALVVRSLTYIFACTPNILEHRKFSVTAFKFGLFSRVKDPDKIFCIADLLSASIMIIENGHEISTNCRFFSHDPIFTCREAGLPFTTVANRPISKSLLFSISIPEDSPPPYSGSPPPYS